jgi:DMSO/TMAO reductase YedYZ molybdopterin-dependent catalytic subunit
MPNSLEALAYDWRPEVDAATWQLTVGGRVREELSLSLEDLRARPAATRAVTLECRRNGRAHTAEWTGTSLRGLLEDAGADDHAVEVLIRGLDRGIEDGADQHFERSLPRAEAMREEVMIAYGIDGRPLAPEHGFPARLIVPGCYEMTSVKRLDRITVLGAPFDGYERGVSRILPRAEMVSPGLPDLATGDRTVGLDACTVHGRAWSGFGPVMMVEVSPDGGRNWSDARLGPTTARWGWREWEWRWGPHETGMHELCCRATDSTGRTQPLEPGGYANNAVQRLRVVAKSTTGASLKAPS